METLASHSYPTGLGWASQLVTYQLKDCIYWLQTHAALEPTSSSSKVLYSRFNNMGDPPATAQLFRNSYVYASIPIPRIQSVEVLVKAIRFSGLIERRIHSSANTYVKIFVDDREVNPQRKVPTAQTLNPSWSFESPIVLHPCPSSEIRISLYRARALRNDEHLCDIKASTWKLLSENNVQHHIRSKASDVIGQIDMSICDPTTPMSGRQADIEAILHQLGVLYLQDKARTRLARPRGLLGSSDTLFDCIGDVLEAFSSVSVVFPICKVAFVLLQAVHKVLENIRSVDEDIRSLFRALHETVRKAMACCGRNPIPGIAADLQRIGRVAGSSAEAVDKWIHEKASKRVFHAGHVQDQLRHCMQELENVQDDIQLNVELALCQTAAWNLALGDDVAPTSPRPTAHPLVQSESPRYRSSNSGEVAIRTEFPAYRSPSPPRSYTRSDSISSHSSRGHPMQPDSPLSAAFSNPCNVHATNDYREQTFDPTQSPPTPSIVLPHPPEAHSIPLPIEQQWDNGPETFLDEEDNEDQDHAVDDYKPYTNSPTSSYKDTN
ncbi:hypothetical protein BDW22DRAFT_199615 [Trametopsis cervina]|nr:hypothetical protein BDW22DRAFT_199615 [Trametopsis cervina]